MLFAMAACSKHDNGTGTHAEDGKEIAKNGSFEGQETHGQVGTVEDMQNSASAKPGFSNAVAEQ
jgi:hypothetical protein